MLKNLCCKLILKPECLLDYDRSKLGFGCLFQKIKNNLQLTKTQLQII